jgi:hypothetical protein
MIQNILIKFIITIFVIFTVTACYDEREGEIAVDAFLAEMSPELARKIDKIETEISLTEEKMHKLSILKRKHPNYAGKIEISRRQWEVLKTKLIQSLTEIKNVVESTYVTYEVDRIQGGNQFNQMSGKLLSSADSVLASAGTTKDAIEQALVETQSLPLLSDDFNTEVAVELPVNSNVIIEPEVTAEPSILPIESTSSFSSISCDAKEFLATIRLNLMMMIISTEKAEQDALNIEVNNASIKFERVIATMFKHEINNASLQKAWAKFKNTHETEIIPAILTGSNDMALKIANGIQAERMKTMSNIIQALNGDDCD